MQQSFEFSLESQIKQVKAHLMNKKSITSWDAITLYHATRLSAIIFNLRGIGMDIVSVWEKDDKSGKRWVRYTLNSALKPNVNA